MDIHTKWNNLIEKSLLYIYEQFYISLTFSLNRVGMLMKMGFVFVTLLFLNFCSPFGPIMNIRPILWVNLRFYAARASIWLAMAYIATGMVVIDIRH